MMDTSPLHLHEELMLLALRDEKGTVAAHEQFDFVLGAALLAELLLAGRVRIDEVKKNKKMVDLVDTKPTGDPLLDECLAKLKDAKRRAALKTWVQRFGHLKRLKHRTAEGLCDRGILRADRDKVLWVFNRRIFPQVDPRPERALVARLRKAIFSSSRDLEPQTTVLVALAHQGRVLKNVFDKDDLKRRKDRLKQIAEGEALAKAAKEAIQAARAAVAVCVMIPAVTAATSAGR